ncbi:MAG: MFS transporter [Clostridiaceae bacterium]|nr:MFS transporter [Bacillota bacterium]NLN51688.1 MFS transporter [Clostridiaceae bacterium]
MKTRKFYGWKIVFAVFIAMLTIYPPVVNSISIYTNPVTSDLGFTGDKFLIYYTVMGLSGVLANSFVGTLLRRVKANLVMSAGAIIVGLSLIGFSQSTQLIHFYIIAVFQGVGLSAICVVPPSVLITNWFNDKRGLALGLALAGTGIGGSIYSPIATQIIVRYGWRTAYLASGLIVLLITLPIVFFVIRFEPSLLGQEPLGGVPETSGQTLSGVSFAKMVKTPAFFLLVASILLGGIIVNGLLVNFTPYINFMGYSPEQGSLILSLSLLFMTLGKLVLGRFYDKLGVNITFIIILLASLLCLVSLIMARIFAFGILYTFAFGLASSNALVTPAILTAALFGQKEFSKKYDFVATFVALSASITPIFTGFFTKAGEEGYVKMLYAFIVLSVLTFITMWVSHKIRPKQDVVVTDE